MIEREQNWWGIIPSILCVCALAPHARASAAPAAQGPGLVAGHSASVTVRLGERIYRAGMLPSGKALQSLLEGDTASEGTAFACVSCHLRSGTGSYEGGVVTLPTHSAALFHPFFRNLRNLSPTERAKRLLEASPNRPAYTDQTLAIAIRFGTDPTGRKFNPVMPRFKLDDGDMGILIHYLHTLSSEFSPGVDETTLRLATVITDEVSPEDRQSMLAPLEDYVTFHNQLRSSFSHWMYRSKTGQEMVQDFRRLSLSQWILKGPASTWPKQLEDHYRQNPVFALVGGISYRGWGPVHAFCERRHIPCILPITDFPVVSETDWYTVYFSKGFHQEGQAVARHLDVLLEGSKPPKILNLTLNTRESKNLSEGFRNTWQEAGRNPAQEILLKRSDLSKPGLLRNLIHRHKPSVLLLWTGPEAFSDLQDIAESPDAPAMIFMSSGYLKARLWELPDSARSMTYLTYPYRPPVQEANYIRNTNTSIVKAAALDGASRITTRAHSLVQVLNMGISEMQRDFYRDNLLDRIGMLPDQFLADYERLSFGPGQRYASKGCYIMQLSSGPAPVLIKKSGWIVQ